MLLGDPFDFLSSVPALLSGLPSCSLVRQVRLCVLVVVMAQGSKKLSFLVATLLSTEKTCQKATKGAIVDVEFLFFVVSYLYDNHILFSSTAAPPYVACLPRLVPQKFFSFTGFEQVDIKKKQNTIN